MTAICDCIGLALVSLAVAMWAAIISAVALWPVTMGVITGWIVAVVVG